MDGLRKCLTDEFTSLYCFNLRGNQRTSGELSRREGGKIFGSGSRAPIAITLMVKNPEKTGHHKLFYHDIGDYLSREEKLQIVQELGSVQNVDWQELQPNDEGDWVKPAEPGIYAIYASWRQGKRQERQTLRCLFVGSSHKPRCLGNITFS